eukprot:TRINITY_DN5989_c0_g2_i1.p1 TRINITY_DN5989_c0_g2~~TRINITY_DN5989_c0_g2_i1.p1  ORF type:complete len:608 (-),score=141.84 TRINITY_DN5989_c0_g2_i1:126-1949(-)
MAAPPVSSQQAAQDNAVSKALRDFRRDLVPALQSDLKDHLIKQAKEDLTEHLRQELRKEVRQLSNKLNKEMAANSSTIKNVLNEQVKKMEQSSKAIDQSTLNLKHIKAFSKTKPGQLSTGRKSVGGLARRPSQNLSQHAHPQPDPGPAENKGLEGQYTAVPAQGAPGAHGEMTVALVGENGRALEITGVDEELPPEPVVEDVPKTAFQQAVADVLNHWVFDAGMAFLLLIGGILMGVSLEYGIDAYMGYYDISCAVIFSIELAARLYCYSWEFFTMEGWEWNMFDMVILVCQLTACISQTSSAASGFKSLRGLRGLRALRSLRVLRTLRLIRFIEEFRSVIVSLLAALKSTLGILLLLALGLYLFGASLAQEVLDRQQLGGTVSPELEKYFGTLSVAMLSLYESVTGGLSWSIAMNVLLEEEAYTMATIYVFFITLVFFVLLNVITAVFTGQAVIALQDDQDLMVIKDIDTLFLKGDLQYGDITWAEFRSMVHTPEMVNLFKSLNIDTSEAAQLFRLLDTQGVGILDHHEFIDGCLRLRGPAKSLELMKLMKEHTAMNIWSEQKLNALDQRMLNLERALQKLNTQIHAQMEVFFAGEEPESPGAPEG